MMNPHDQAPATPSWRPRSAARTAFGVMLAVAAVLLILEHRTHLLGAWPLLFLALCLGSHFFMHRGQGRGGGHGH